MRVVIQIAALGLTVLVLAAAQNAEPDARPAPPPTPVAEPGETTVFSPDLNPDYTPCRVGMFPCGERQSTCITHDDYAASTLGPQPGCPVLENPSPTPPSGMCTLLNNECSFSEIAPTCVSWLPRCASQYSCSTQDDYQALSSQENTSTCSLFLKPPTPATVCVPVNVSCEWYDPCAVWQSWCGGRYVCGSEAEYAAFRHGPIPICATRPVFAPPEPMPEPIPQPMPEGECLYRDGQCQWSGCRSWLGHYNRSWNCGSEYEFQVFQTLPAPESFVECLRLEQGNIFILYFHIERVPFPPCANPGPPPEPGVCEYDIELGNCEFHGETECTGGWEYQLCSRYACPRTCDHYQQLYFCSFPVCIPGCSCPAGTLLHEDQCVPPSQCPTPECTGGWEYSTCGSSCPRTCDNYQQLDLFCTPVCIPGCFCPGGTLLHEDQCVQPSQCPTPNVCEDFECPRGSECQVYEPTGEAFCEPNCKELNPCEPNQDCVINQVQCIRAPCPGVLSCEDKVPLPITLDLQLSPESGVVVEVQSDGALFIRLILRDANHRRYKDLVLGSSGSVTFSGLPSGLTRVKAKAIRPGGSRHTTDWHEIVVP